MKERYSYIIVGVFYSDVGVNVCVNERYGLWPSLQKAQEELVAIKIETMKDAIISGRECEYKLEENCLIVEDGDVLEEWTIHKVKRN